MAVAFLVNFGAENVLANNISIKIDDERIVFPDQGPYMDDSNRVQVPVRFLLEELGGNVDWDGEEEQVEISYGEEELVLNIKEKKYQLNGETKTMDTVPKISEQGKTMVPLRFASEGLGTDVEWNADNNTVYISTRDDSVQKDEEGSSNDPSNIEEFEGMDIEVHASALNVRNHPTIHSDQVHQIKAGETYQVLDIATAGDENEYQDWLKIDISKTGALEKEGWISADYVELHDSDEYSQNDTDEEEREKRKEASEHGEHLCWWDDEVQQLFPRGATATVTDVATGLTFQVKRRGGTNHADVEPLTAKDTATLREAYGGSWCWSPRAIIVSINGRNIAASMNGMPHGRQNIHDNNFPGHICIHFKNSKTHNTNSVSPEHQSRVKEAAGLN